ncbi:hypothetical protein RUM43_012283 [Polyplax serrata]|uniref:Uncharacterized protein n=1 Tax=Polyplax serrata TaxID=468196 RepID=A0AAN8S7D5_POLSC
MDGVECERVRFKVLGHASDFPSIFIEEVDDEEEEEEEDDDEEEVKEVEEEEITKRKTWSNELEKLERLTETVRLLQLA